MALCGDSLYIIGNEFSYSTYQSVQNYAIVNTATKQVVTTNFITDGVVALFGTNEGCTVGVGNAIAAEGEDCAVLGVGFDKSDAILNLVAAGELVATTAQNPYNMGYYGIKTAVEFLTNGTTEFENVDTGVTMLTAQYIADNGLLG
jgi:ribose transport system substrate-binding protein